MAILSSSGKSFLTIILLSIVLGWSCNNNSCKKAICTSILNMIIIEVVNHEGSPVTLDEYYTVRNNTGEKIIPANKLGDGYYNILDDTYHKSLINSTENFTFIGIIDEKIVISESFIISADCCHIKKEKGTDKVVLQ